MTPDDPIEVALREDIGPGDITTEALVSERATAQARIVARERAVLAGTETAAEVFRRVDSGLQVEIYIKDGTAVLDDEAILEVNGSARSILTAERVALNFLQRLSGIATLTRAYVDGVGKSRARILDTRKTTPGLRALEKAAVVAGGGLNHRHGLWDRLLVKDNHLVLQPDLDKMAAALREAKSRHPDVLIEVEADDLEQVHTLVQLEGIDIILLDNMETSEMREAVALGRNRQIKFEASGGVNLRTVRRIAATGVDYISVGALTHSAPAVDLSLELVKVSG